MKVAKLLGKSILKIVHPAMSAGLVADAENGQVILPIDFSFSQ